MDGHPCCSRKQPARVKHQTLKDVGLCDACARAWLKRVQLSVAESREVDWVHVRVRTQKFDLMGRLIDIEVLGLDGKWEGVTKAPRLKAALGAYAFG